MAFEKTGLSKDKFNVTKWGKDKNGKSFPVEWRADNGAGGAVRGHIFVDDVPYNR